MLKASPRRSSHEATNCLLEGFFRPGADIRFRPNTRVPRHEAASAWTMRVRDELWLPADACDRTSELRGAEPQCRDTLLQPVPALWTELLVAPKLLA